MRTARSASLNSRGILRAKGCAFERIDFWSDSRSGNPSMSEICSGPLIRGFSRSSPITSARAINPSHERHEDVHQLSRADGNPRDSGHINDSDVVGLQFAREFRLLEALQNAFEDLLCACSISLESTVADGLLIQFEHFTFLGVECGDQRALTGLRRAEIVTNVATTLSVSAFSRPSAEAIAVSILIMSGWSSPSRSASCARSRCSPASSALSPWMKLFEAIGGRVSSGPPLVSID